MSPTGDSCVTGHPWVDSINLNSGAFVFWVMRDGNYTKLSHTIPKPIGMANHAWYSGNVWHEGYGAGRSLDFNGADVIIGSSNDGENPSAGAVKIYQLSMMGLQPPYTGTIEATKNLVVKDGLIYGFV